jgi:hypothetical protein
MKRATASSAFIPSVRTTRGLRGHRTAGLAQDLREVDGVDDLTGENGEVQRAALAFVDRPPRVMLGVAALRRLRR